MRVPREFVRDGQIANIGYDATGQLTLANDVITFQARLWRRGARHLRAGRATWPPSTPRKTGVGMAFEPETKALGDTDAGTTDETAPEPPPAPTTAAPHVAAPGKKSLGPVLRRRQRTARPTMKQATTARRKRPCPARKWDGGTAVAKRV